jgi:eukaryotic-like serine/threonine-protein kinase
MPDSIPPRSGRVIAGKYRIDSMIGEGAMGTVWMATHVNLGQRVAVKLISPELADSESARLRFDAEAKAAAALRSRFVVHIYDSGITDDNIPYLVMEYLTGESLEERVERGGPLSLQYATDVITQVARGLSRAHAMKIVHRDLKPANVFLAQTEDGEEVAKILDFGVAKIRKDGPEQSATATGAVVGTPLFMSPEQARGLKTVDHRSDLYSLGMVAFWILTGTHAFSGEAFGDLVLAICTQPLPKLQHVAPWLPEELDGWFAKACARDAEERFQSAEEFAEALLAAAGVDPSALNRSGSSLPTGRFAMPSSFDVLSDSGDRPLAAASGADTVLVNATAAGVAASRTSRPASARSWTAVLVGLGVLVAAAAGGAIVVLASGGGPDPTAAAQPAATHEPRPTSAMPPAAPAPPVVEPTLAAAPSASAPEPARPSPARVAAPAVAPRPLPAAKPPRKKGGGDIDVGF